MALGHAILASLLDEPQTGYDLAKQFGTDGYFWRASHQQIYRELAKLEAEGAIATTADEPGARNDRKRTVTPSGRDQLAAWARLPSEPATIKEDVLVKCLALGLIDPSEFATQIAQHRALHDARRQRHEEALAAQFPTSLAPTGAMLGRYLALHGGVAYERAWVEWADIALQSIAPRSS